MTIGVSKAVVNDDDDDDDEIAYFTCAKKLES